MPTDKNVRALAAEVAVQDAELLKEFADRAMRGQGDYAVAYAVLRAVQTVSRFVGAACMDDDERSAVPPAEVAAGEPAPGPEVIKASAPKGTTGKRRAPTANGA